MLDDQAGRAGRDGAAVGVEPQARHQRAVAQHELARLVVGRRPARCSAPPLNTSPSRTRRAARADRERDRRRRRAISGRAGLRAATTATSPGAPGAVTPSTLKTGVCGIGQAVVDRRAGRRAAMASRSRLQRLAVGRRSAAFASSSPGGVALVFAAADRARRAVVEGRQQRSVGRRRPAARGHARDRRRSVPAGTAASWFQPMTLPPPSRMSRRSQMRISLDGHRRRRICRDAAAPGFRRRRSRRRARRPAPARCWPGPLARPAPSAAPTAARAR